MVLNNLLIGPLKSECKKIIDNRTGIPVMKTKAVLLIFN
jgi:hypothetical protein